MKLTLDELITLMEPQAQRDKKLIVQCIDGLTEYAAELRQKAGDAGKAESSALRELIDRLEGYWGLDNSGENRLSAFDRRMPGGGTIGAAVGTRTGSDQWRQCLACTAMPWT